MHEQGHGIRLDSDCFNGSFVSTCAVICSLHSDQVGSNFSRAPLNCSTQLVHSDMYDALTLVRSRSRLMGLDTEAGIRIDSCVVVDKIHDRLYGPRRPWLFQVDSGCAELRLQRQRLQGSPSWAVGPILWPA